MVVVLPGREGEIDGSNKKNDYRKVRRKNRISPVEEKMKGVIYTCITGGYDKLMKPKRVEKFDYVCFTDQEMEPVSPWQIKIIKYEPRIDRKIKIKFHEYIHGYDYSIWVDGSIRVGAGVGRFVSGFLKSHGDIMLARHPQRNCIYEEAVACKDGMKDDLLIIDAMMDKYRAEGYPRGNGLYANGVLIRKHNNRVIELMNTWWDEFSSGSKRDQLSLPVALWRNPVSIKPLTFVYTTDSIYFHWNKYHN